MAFKAAFCMYCYESRGTDVDHFEPIGKNPGRTFDWSNHLLACGYCNQQAKRELFPVDAGGSALLLDPFADDAGLHLAIGSSGALLDLTDRGRTTIEVLRLNERADLVEARRISYDVAVHFLTGAAAAGRPLDSFELEALTGLAVVDALHYLVHDVTSGRFDRMAVDPTTARLVGFNIGQLTPLFAGCKF